MERSADFEMPSPKRIRLEDTKPEAAIDLASPVDHTDDFYGPPLMQPRSPTKSPKLLPPVLDAPAFPIDQKPFQLPGLGMLDGGPTSSTQPFQQQSQTSSIPEAEQSSSTANAEDMELEYGQKHQVNGWQDSAVDDKRMVEIENIHPEDASLVPSEILADKDDIAIAKAEERVSGAEAPVSQEVTGSGSGPAQTTVDWHSSGTVIDNGLWLGGYSIDKVPSTVPDSNAARVGTHPVVWRYMDVDPVDDDFHEQSLSGTMLIAERSEKTVFEKPASENLVDPDKDPEEAEFELDSSPLESDSFSDDSTDTSSSDDSDADDYEMLSPAEQARRLMAEDGGSDGDGKGKGGRVIAEVPRTLNEKPDEFVPKPSVTVTEDMRIEELGLVENTVENLALIKANTSGEYQVLESGSLLCLQDRTVIGVVSETLGRVQQPYYSIRFTNAAAIAEAGIDKGTKIMYVAQHSTTVFTQPLKAFKGSDASNLHDEEVGDDELEFSDDEAEAEHKRQTKQQRMTKRNNRDGQLDGYSRGPQQRPGEPGPRLNGGLHPVQEHPPSSAEVALNYDDTDGMNVDSKEDEDGLYTPLARPSNLHEILSGKVVPVTNHEGRRNVNRGRGDGRGAHRGSNRGRGDNRGRGNDRGMRDSKRGGTQNSRNRGDNGQAHGHPIPRTPHTNSFSPSQAHGLPPRPSPEANSYQRSTPSGMGFPYPTPQQSPVPPQVYQVYQQQQQNHQPHTHPGYPPQYPNAYNQSSFQQQPPYTSYPSNIHQQNYSQYHQPQQSVPHQGYTQQFTSQPDRSFAPPQSQYPASIPLGAHINPNIFRQQGQPSASQAWHQGYNQQQQQQPQHLASPASSSTGPPAPGLQDLLRGFGRGGGG